MIPEVIQGVIKHDDRLKHLQYLSIAGSHAYGTAVEGSDLDIRGWYFPPVSDIIGIHDKASSVVQYTLDDVVFYTFHKFVHLLAQCNPNVVEQVGVNSACRIYQSHTATLLLDNLDLFLSKRAYKTFGGYAQTMLKRFEQGDSENQTMGHRNRKATTAKQLKHLMHLIRLYYMGIDILKNHQVITYRVYEHDLLMSIRHGEVPISQIFKLRDKLEVEMQEAYEKSTLPQSAQIDKIDELVTGITLDYIKNPERFNYIY